MRRPFTRADLRHQEISRATLRARLRSGEWQRLAYDTFIEGGNPPTSLERALGLLVVTNGIASHSLAGVLHDLDGVQLTQPLVTLSSTSRVRRLGICRRELDDHLVTEVVGYRCTTGLQTLIDLAHVVDELVWEQALESVLRRKLATVGELQAVLPALSNSKTPGLRLIRHALQLRGALAPPTESLLETLMVQLIRNEKQLPTPVRQVEVFSRHGAFVARVDLAWPDYGVFIELDGQQHQDQPVYDARRETAIVAATGWLPGRFTWTEVVNHPNATRRRLVELFEAGRFRRPLSPTQEAQKSSGSDRVLGFLGR